MDTMCGLVSRSRCVWSGLLVGGRGERGDISPAPEPRVRCFSLLGLSLPRLLSNEWKADKDTRMTLG
jgi:hypothetical protein